MKEQMDPWDKYGPWLMVALGLVVCALGIHSEWVIVSGGR